MPKYQPSHNATELTLFVENEALLYPQIKAVVANLQKKYRKGIFDHDKAIKAFYHVANRGAQLYCQRFGSWSDKYYTMFSTSDRFTCATDLLESYIDDIKEA